MKLILTTLMFLKDTCEFDPMKTANEVFQAQWALCYFYINALIVRGFCLKCESCEVLF